MHPPLLSHDLYREFPDLVRQIDSLKTSNPRFARLLDDYDALDKQIFQFEKGLGELDAQALEELKRQRVKLKDDLFQMLKAI
ncbi:MAG: DUF465 domain-containing protein [Rhodocyclaceae bacterium]